MNGLIPSWEHQMGLMSHEMDTLKTNGHWRNGGRTLMRALWVQHNEVMLCRGLAWLLTPDGWHGLGTSLLEQFLQRVSASTQGLATATVTTEEQRGRTRADIVIRTPGQCLLIEAKVWAGEGPDQARRLAEGWSDENPTLVFLTRDGRAPTTSAGLEENWRAVSWLELADLLGRSIASSERPAPGAQEYLETLQWYGGSAS